MIETTDGKGHMLGEKHIMKIPQGSTLVLNLKINGNSQGFDEIIRKRLHTALLGVNGIVLDLKFERVSPSSKQVDIAVTSVEVDTRTICLHFRHPDLSNATGVVTCKVREGDFEKVLSTLQGTRKTTEQITRAPMRITVGGPTEESTPLFSIAEYWDVQKNVSAFQNYYAELYHASNHRISKADLHLIITFTLENDFPKLSFGKVPLEESVACLVRLGYILRVPKSDVAFIATFAAGYDSSAPISAQVEAPAVVTEVTPVRASAQLLDAATLRRLIAEKKGIEGQISALEEDNRKLGAELIQSRGGLHQTHNRQLGEFEQLQRSRKAQASQISQDLVPLNADKRRIEGLLADVNKKIEDAVNKQKTLNDQIKAADSTGIGGLKTAQQAELTQLNTEIEGKTKANNEKIEALEQQLLDPEMVEAMEYVSLLQEAGSLTTN